MSNNTRIRKVHVESFIAILSDLFQKGVDYVDVYGVAGDPADSIGLSFSKDYMSKDMETNFDEMTFSPDWMKSSEEEEEPKKGNFKIDLSNEDDLNQLL